MYGTDFRQVVVVYSELAACSRQAKSCLNSYSAAAIYADPLVRAAPHIPYYTFSLLNPSRSL